MDTLELPTVVERVLAEVERRSSPGADGTSLRASARGALLELWLTGRVPVRIAERAMCEALGAIERRAADGNSAETALPTAAGRAA